LWAILNILTMLMLQGEYSISLIFTTKCYFKKVSFFAIYICFQYK
jgi:hypothetical protein